LSQKYSQLRQDAGVAGSNLYLGNRATLHKCIHSPDC